MSAKSRRGRGSPVSRRPTGSRPPKRVFWIYLEGKVTEPEYFRWLKTKVKERAAIKVALKGKTPSLLVKAARKDKESGRGDVDEYWCVFDVEAPTQHGDLDTARDLAEGKIKLAVSNPCFELWLLLHHRSFARYMTTADAVKERQKLDEATDKHLGKKSEFYMKHLDDAVRRARELREQHSGDEKSSPRGNPSTDMDLLIGRLRTE